jgi:phytoene desaturase
LDVPADFDAACRVFEKVESGAGERLRSYIEQCGRKYRFAMENFIYKNYRSIFDFLNFTSLRNLSTLNVFSNYRDMIRRYISHPDLQKILEFPVVFLGSSAKTTPAMYTLMNYIDFSLGTWYPDGGFSGVADAMYRVCRELGVHFEFDTEVEAIESTGGRAGGLRLKNGDRRNCDSVVANADYPHVELDLLDSAERSIPEKRWRKKSLAPAVLNYYVALDRRLEGLAHHTFFFDSDWDGHFDAVYGNTPRWVERPLFYIHMPSVTDPRVAPEGGEVLYILIPAACGLSASEKQREDFFRHAIARMEEHTGMDITSHIVRYSSYSHEEFSRDYHAYRGTAFGLGQTMMQTAYFRPPNRSKKLPNLYYTGHYTVPGTGTTMSTISGRVVAQRIGEES